MDTTVKKLTPPSIPIIVRLRKYVCLYAPLPRYLLLQKAQKKTEGKTFHTVSINGECCLIPPLKLTPNVSTYENYLSSSLKIWYLGACRILHKIDSRMHLWLQATWRCCNESLTNCESCSTSKRFHNEHEALCPCPSCCYWSCRR